MAENNYEMAKDLLKNRLDRPEETERHLVLELGRMPPAFKNTTTETVENLLIIFRQLETSSRDVESKLVLNFVE